MATEISGLFRFSLASQEVEADEVFFCACVLLHVTRAHIEDLYAKSITKAFQKHFVSDTQALG